MPGFSGMENTSSGRKFSENCDDPLQLDAFFMYIACKRTNAIHNTLLSVPIVPFHTFTPKEVTGVAINQCFVMVTVVLFQSRTSAEVVLPEV